MTDGLEDEDGGEDRMPRRPRRRLLTRWSALLLAAMMCAIGFYVGVRVEKGHIASSPTTIGAGGFAARAGAAAGGTTSGSSPGASAAAGSGAGATGASATGTGATGARGGSAAAATGAGGFAAHFGGGDATFGTVASLDGKTLTLTEASGDTVKVKLSSATKISKTESAKRKQIHPGDTITVSGVTGKQGTVSAATVTDSGATTTGSSSSTGSGSTGGAGGSSVSSLFSGG
jgi:Domain of unknown function (DUF5666)